MKNNVLYFCNCDMSMKNGHGQMVRAHYQMLNELYPGSITTIMIPDKYKENINNEIYCFPHPSQLEKLVAVLMGYTPDLSVSSINRIIDIIENKNINIILVESSMFGNLIQCIKEKYPEIMIITYFTDVEADLLKQEMKHCSLKRKLVCKRLLENEKKTVHYADKKFVLNKRDEALYIKSYKEKPDQVIPLIITKQLGLNSAQRHITGEKVKMLFVGGDFWPNVIGIRWFVNEVLPQISVPYELNIIGLNMERYRDELESKSNSINVIGTVDNLSPFFEEADLFIAPIRDGGGMKYKTAEALSYGKTFIGLEEALIGYWEYVPHSLKNQGIYMCENEVDFAQRINELGDLTFKKCRPDIKEFVESICSYEVVLEKFKSLFII